MMIRFYITKNETKGILNAERYLDKEIRDTLLELGRIIRTTARLFMRKDTGAEQESLQISVRGSKLSQRLYIYSTLNYAFSDALGIKAGKIFPPYGRGSRIRQWASRRAKGIANKPVYNRQGFRLSETEDKRKVSHLSRSKKQNIGKVQQVKSGNGTTFRQGTKTEKAVDRRAAKRQARIERATDRIAFLTARKIFEKGTRGTYWHNKARNSERATVERELKLAFKRAVDKINRGGA